MLLVLVLSTLIKHKTKKSKPDKKRNWTVRSINDIFIIAGNSNTRLQDYDRVLRFLNYFVRENT